MEVFRVTAHYLLVFYYFFFDIRICELLQARAHLFLFDFFSFFCFFHSFSCLSTAFCCCCFFFTFFLKPTAKLEDSWRSFLQVSPFGDFETTFRLFSPKTAPGIVKNVQFSLSWPRFSLLAVPCLTLSVIKVFPFFHCELFRIFSVAVCFTLWLSSDFDSLFDAF